MRVQPFLVLPLLVLFGCSQEAPVGPGGKPEGSITLSVEGGSVKIPLRILNVFLVEDGTEPEVFEILGEGVRLVGEFAPGAGVGYDEKWEVLFGKEIPLLPEGGDPRGPAGGILTLPGRPAWPVLGGSIRIERRTGTYIGVEGDTMLHGRVTVRVSTDAGERTLEGTFSVQGVIWG